MVLTRSLITSIEDQLKPEAYVVVGVWTDAEEDDDEATVEEAVGAEA